MIPLFSLAAGLLFGLGLAISGMINPARVLNFFDWSERWDPTLALVFAGALAVALPAYQWILHHRERPLLDSEFHIPDSQAITPPVVLGSALFGIGWGLAGFCPGPGLAALAAPSTGVAVFVAAMLVGAATRRLLP